MTISITLRKNLLKSFTNAQLALNYILQLNQAVLLSDGSPFKYLRQLLTQKR